jgi:hypothetical protein
MRFVAVLESRLDRQVPGFVRRLSRDGTRCKLSQSGSGSIDSGTHITKARHPTAVFEKQVGQPQTGRFVQSGKVLI